MIDFTLLENDTEKVDYIKSIGILVQNNEVTPEKLNESLANYYTINSYLTLLRETTGIEYEQKKIDYKIWHDGKFIVERDKLNVGRASTKFASKEEIECSITSYYTEEYRAWQNELIIAEKRRQLYYHLHESWKSMSKILCELSSNMRSELHSLYVEKEANKNLTKECLIRKVKKVVKEDANV